MAVTRRLAILIGTALLVGLAPTAGAAVPKLDGPCSRVGARVGGGPNVTLRCERVHGKRVWKKLAAGRGPQTPAAPGPQPPGSRTCPSPSGRATFTAAFTDAARVSLVTLGRETNDPRFVYVWNASPAEPAPIYAPADGVLFRIRHKTANAVFPSDDYDLFFAADCGAVYRFNHITSPRADLVAAYPAGTLPSGDYLNGGLDIPERVVPRTSIAVRAGEPLGATTGTPVAHDWDYSVYVDGKAICPFDLYAEPLRSSLRSLLGPKGGPPTPGYPCEVEPRSY